jgi:hypothetical protein
VRRQTLLLRFEPEPEPPSGEPPAFDVTAGPGTVTLLDGDDTGVPTGASYRTHVTMTGPDTFDKTGELSLDGRTLTLTTVGTGLLQPAPQEGTAMGAVTFLAKGTGRFEGASGLLTSSFELQTDGSGSAEQQVLRLFLP